jgi:hypothetical protein
VQFNWLSIFKHSMGQLNGISVDNDEGLSVLEHSSVPTDLVLVDARSGHGPDEAACQHTYNAAIKPPTKNKTPPALSETMLGNGSSIVLDIARVVPTIARLRKCFYLTAIHVGRRVRHEADFRVSSTAPLLEHPEFVLRPLRELLRSP